MNTPNPLVPQGSFLDKPGKSHIRIAVFTILAIHVVLLGALLLQGCKRTTEVADASPKPTNDYAPWTEFTPPPPSVDQPGTGSSLDGVSMPPPPSSPPPSVAISTPPAPSSPPPGPGTSSRLPASPDGSISPGPLAPLNPTEFPSPTIPIPNPPISDPDTPPISPAISEPASVTPNGTQYVVIKGDSFFLLAKKFGISVQEIANNNPTVDPRRLQIGQKLFIPAPLPSNLAAAATTAGTMAPGKKTHVVKSGDTLSNISRKYGTTVKALQSENGLRTTTIKVGQKLIIP